MPGPTNVKEHFDVSEVRVPAEDGGVYLQPRTDQLAATVLRNHVAFEECSTRLAGGSLQELRAATRRRLAGDENALLIVTGHQPDFIHAGVWAKHVAAQRLATAVDGLAMNLVVDHDSPGRMAVAVPVIRDGVTTDRRWVPYARGSAGLALESLDAADARTASAMEDDFRDALGERYGRSLLPAFFSAYKTSASESDWVGQFVGARRKVEDQLGVHIEDRRVSDVWVDPLLGHVLADAPAFVSAYNTALAAYRERYGVQSDSRPVPDLHVDDGVFELPLWVYRRGEVRQRLMVAQRGELLHLYAGDTPVGALDRAEVSDAEGVFRAVGSLSPWRIRPRALMLTIWARLMLADIFIHGIGGAIYDEITDGIIEKYFNLAPPMIACVSATLRLDLPRHALPEDAVARAKGRLRDLQYNPQRLIDDPSVRGLADARRQAVLRAKQLRDREPNHHAARRRAFEEIRAISAQIAETRPDIGHKLESELESTLRKERENQVAQDRTWFFAMHDRDTLGRLMDALPSVESLAASIGRAEADRVD